MQKRLSSLAQTASALSSMSDPPPASQDRRQIQASLQNAWGTELLLGLAGHFKFSDDLVRITNNWAVVQAYYVTYHATQAYSVAKGQRRPDSHPKTQREFGSRWIDRPLALAPWTFGVGPNGFINVPPTIQINTSLHPWSDCSSENAWSLVGKAFDSTRGAALADSRDRRRTELQKANRKAWHDEERKRREAGKRSRKEPHFSRPRLSPQEQAAIDQGMRPFGLIDYLYRLRIRTNYEDASMFTDGPEEDSTISARVHGDLTYLSAATLIVHELHIGRLVGKKAFVDWVDRWMQAHMPSGMKIGLAMRRDILDSTI